MTRIKLANRKAVLLDNDQVPVYAEDTLKRLQAGESIDILAQEYQVSGSHLRTWLRRNGFVPKRQPTLWVASNTVWERDSDAG